MCILRFSTAIGYGLSNSSFSLALSSFFTNKLNKASGLAMTLAGIGPIMYPPLINYLLNSYGVRGCMLIIGAIALNMLVAAILLQPLKWHLVEATPCTTDVPKINAPNILPNVSTMLSIGHFSNASSKYIKKCPNRIAKFVATFSNSTTILSILNSCTLTHSIFAVNPNSTLHLPYTSNDFMGDRQSSRFQVDHDIDTQSIYGFDQIVRRPSISNHMARNFSRRTLCNSSTVPHFEKRNSMMNVEDGASIRDELHLSGGKPMRWFEPGSVESIHEYAPVPVEIARNNVYDPFMSRPIRKPSLLTRPFNSKHNLQPIPQKASLPFFGSDRPLDGERIVSVPNQMNNLDKEPSEKLSHSVHNINCDRADGGGCNILGQWCMKFFDLDLLRDKVYVNILIGMSISIFAENNFAILTPFILSDLSFSTDQISTIMFTMAIADLVSRFCSPFVADKLNLSIRWSYVISLTLLVITRTRKLLICCRHRDILWRIVH